MGDQVIVSRETLQQLLDTALRDPEMIEAAIREAKEALGDAEGRG